MPDPLPDARRILAEINKPGCSLWASQLAPLIGRLIRALEQARKAQNEPNLWRPMK